MGAIECRIKIPNVVKKENIEMAYNIIKKNMEIDDFTTMASEEAYYNDKKHISLMIGDRLIGFIPKTWLVPI